MGLCWRIPVEDSDAEGISSLAYYGDRSIIPSYPGQSRQHAYLWRIRVGVLWQLCPQLDIDPDFWYQPKAKLTWNPVPLNVTETCSPVTLHIWAFWQLGTEYVYGNFSPSVAPDIVFVALFFIAALVICIQIGRNRRETLNPIGVCFLFLGTPLLQFAGYTIRIPSVLSPSSSGLYLANMILIGLGPLYCSITNLLVFAALVTYAGLQYSPWKPWVIVSQTIVWHIQCIQLQARGLNFILAGANGRFITSV